MSTVMVPHARQRSQMAGRPPLRLVPTPPAPPPKQPPFYPVPNSLGPYLSVLRNSAMRLYCYLKEHANRRGAQEYCDRGYEAIARDLVLSRRMVIYAERELERYGLLQRHAWQGRYQGKRANRYTFPTPTGQPKARPPRTRRKRAPDAALPARDAAAKSAMDCTLTLPAADKPKVQQIASVKVQYVAPIQEYKHKNVVNDGGGCSNLGAGEPPPSTDISAPETTIATPSLSDAPDERIHQAWQPTPALEAEAHRRGYYAVLGAHGIEDSTTRFRDYYDRRTVRPTWWLKWIGEDACKHPDWQRYRARARDEQAVSTLRIDTDERWRCPKCGMLHASAECPPMAAQA